MKHLSTLLLLSTLFFTACGSESGGSTGESEDSNEAFYFSYKTAEFEMEVPDDWEIVDHFTSEYPEDLRVAFKNKIKDSIFTANVTVLREENEKSDTSYDFAQRKMNDHEETLLNYSLISEEVINLSVGGAESKTLLTVFEGKNSSAGASLTFMQVYLTKDDAAWIVTATYRSGEEEFTVEKMDTMLRSFTLQ